MSQPLSKNSSAGGMCEGGRLFVALIMSKSYFEIDQLSNEGSREGETKWKKFIVIKGIIWMKFFRETKWNSRTNLILKQIQELLIVLVLFMIIPAFEPVTNYLLT